MFTTTLPTELVRLMATALLEATDAAPGNVTLGNKNIQPSKNTPYQHCLNRNQVRMQLEKKYGHRFPTPIK